MRIAAIAFLLLTVAGYRGAISQVPPRPITVSVTSAAELDIPGCINSRYSDYEIRFRLFPQADGADVMAQVGAGSYDTAASYSSALTYTNLTGPGSGMHDTWSSGVGNLGFYLAAAARKNSAVPVSGTIKLIGASVSGIQHFGRGWVTALVPLPGTGGTPPGVFALNWNYQWGGTTAMDRIRFIVSGGKITGTATCQPLSQ